MNHSGDAAEQIVRISLEGIDYAIRITGSAAKNIAAFLLAAFKSDGTDGKLKLMGKERLVKMLKSGQQTKIFAVKNSDLKQFAVEAKRYGVTYCVLKEKGGAPDSLVEIMVTETDAGRVSNIMDRLEFAAVDMAALETTQEPMPAGREAPDVNDTDKFLDDYFESDGKPKKNELSMEKELATGTNPTKAGLEQGNKDALSEPRSEMPSSSAEEKPKDKKPASVRQFLRERTAQAAKKREENRAERTAPKAKAEKQQKYHQHQQPKRTVYKKPKNKERG